MLSNTVYVRKALTKSCFDQQSDLDSELFWARGDLFRQILAIFGFFGATEPDLPLF